MVTVKKHLRTLRHKGPAQIAKKVIEGGQPHCGQQVRDRKSCNTVVYFAKIAIACQANKYYDGQENEQEQLFGTHP
jgi:hypothetical protein